MPNATPPVSALIAQAFTIAMSKYNAELMLMTNMSGRMASRCLLRFAVFDIERQTQLDVVLRCMEDELALRGVGAASEENIMTDHFQHMFSGMWIGGWY